MKKTLQPSFFLQTFKNHQSVKNGAPPYSFDYLCGLFYIFEMKNNKKNAKEDTSNISVIRGGGDEDGAPPAS
jgi:hypothetical protein